MHGSFIPIPSRPPSSRFSKSLWRMKKVLYIIFLFFFWRVMFCHLYNNDYRHNTLMRHDWGENDERFGRYNQPATGWIQMADESRSKITMERHLSNVCAWMDQPPSRQRFYHVFNVGQLWLCAQYGEFFSNISSESMTARKRHKRKFGISSRQLRSHRQTWFARHFA